MTLADLIDPQPWRPEPMTTETTDDTDAIERIQTVMRGIAGLIAALDKFSDKREMARAIQVEATALAQFAAELAAAHD